MTDPIRGASEPDRWWTFTNIAEATPEVMSPLCWSVWGDHLEEPWRQAWFEFGVLPRSAVRHPTDPNERFVACFYGRQALNVDLVLRYMGALPGTSPAEVEQHLIGTVRRDSPVIRTSYARLPALLVRSARVLTTQSRLVRRTFDEQMAWWSASVDGSLGDPRALLTESCRRFRTTSRVCVRTRSVVQTVQSQLTRLTERAGVPELISTLFAGFGGIEETEIAQQLWECSRGAREVDGFLARYGFLGPAEGNVYTRSWRDDPTPVHDLVAGLARRSDLERPRDRESVTVAAREQAEQVLLQRLPALRRPVARKLLRMAAAAARDLELGKACQLSAIDGCRAAARDLGREFVAAGAFDDVDDAFFLTTDELLAGPSGELRELVAFRRERHEEYRRCRLPVTFCGMPEPLPDPGLPATDTLAGVAGGPGAVEGRAVVVTAPDEGADTLEQGDILVCRFTDPSWAPLFLMVDGLVIDLGTSASHGAIVARELGIPCVIGTGDSTSWLRTGDRVRVDGSVGTVEILHRSEQPT